MIFVTGFKEELEDRLRHATFARPPEHMLKPVEGRALVARSEQVTGRPEGQTVRVLMADDDTAVTAFVQRVLPESRYHVEVATDGEQCLHILRLSTNSPARLLF